MNTNWKSIMNEVIRQIDLMDVRPSIPTSMENKYIQAGGYIPQDLFLGMRVGHVRVDTLTDNGCIIMIRCCYCYVECCFCPDEPQMNSACICTFCEKLALGHPVIRTRKDVKLAHAYTLCIERGIPLRNRTLRYAFLRIQNVKSPQKRKLMRQYLQEHVCIY